jgi:hypothetical protein
VYIGLRVRFETSWDLPCYAQRVNIAVTRGAAAAFAFLLGGNQSRTYLANPRALRLMIARFDVDG